MALKQNEDFSDTVHRSADCRQGARQKTQNAGAEVPNSIFRSSSTTTAAPRTGFQPVKNAQKYLQPDIADTALLSARVYSSPLPSLCVKLQE